MSLNFLHESKDLNTILDGAKISLKLLMITKMFQEHL